VRRTCTVVVIIRRSIVLHGELRNWTVPRWDRETVQGLLEPICPSHAMTRFRADKNVDFAFPRLAAQNQTHRFRATYFLSSQQMGACFRVIPRRFPDFSLRRVFQKNWRLSTGPLSQTGLVLFCGSPPVPARPPRWP